MTDTGNDDPAGPANCISIRSTLRPLMYSVREDGTCGTSPVRNETVRRYCFSSYTIVNVHAPCKGAVPIHISGYIARERLTLLVYSV